MVIKNYKREQIKSTLDQNRGNPTKFWENINLLIGKNNSAFIQSLNSEDGSETYEGMELAEHINRYFASIGAKPANNIICGEGVDPSNGLSMGPLSWNSDDICNVNVTKEDLRLVLKGIDIDKSSAIPNIRTKVSVHAFRNQEQRIVKMYNGSLTLCTFPDKWKRATI